VVVTVTGVITETVAVEAPRAAPAAVADRRRDLQRTFRLLLATVWLLDAVLQIQPFMFTPGSSGFSGMLGGMGAGNPSWVAHTITWNASIVAGHPVLTNTGFALVQFLIAFGIVFGRTCKAALTLSVVWALGVWWFGEGLGNLLHGGATPLGGGPGGVLFYALLAAVLWPSSGSDLPFVAARAVGVNAARAIWAGMWGLLAVLAVVGSGRSPSALNGLVTSLAPAQPGWLSHLDRYTAALLLHDGTALAIAFAILCVLLAVAVYLPAPVMRAAVVVAVVVYALIWVGVQNFGGILGGGATDPNSGPLVILFALAYWPLDAAAQLEREARGAMARGVSTSCC
jgi:hypothetical protein